MRFSIDYLENHGIYRLHNDVLAFFNATITQNKFRTNFLFSDSLNSVITNSVDLLKIFKKVFKVLNEPGINKEDVYNALIHNNNIQELLENLEYPLENLPVRVIEVVKELYTFLWLSTIKTQTSINNYGSLNDHYNQLDSLNRQRTNRICPFCGLEKLKNPREQRNEYDHYLDKDRYSFLSINFKNLVPMCSTCNKRPNKGTKDVIIDENMQRRIAYYPYGAINEFVINLTVQNIFGIDCNWNAITTCLQQNQAFSTWKNIFNIDTRYSNFFESSYESWLKNFNAYFEMQIPTDLAHLRDNINTYLTYRNACAIENGDFLEKRFWNYFIQVPDADLNLFLQYLNVRNSPSYN